MPRIPGVRFLAVLALLGGCGSVPPVPDRPAATLADHPPQSAGPLAMSRACGEHTAREHGHAPSADPALDAELAAFQGLVERALVYRAETLKLAERLRDKLDRDEPLSGLDLARLKQGTVDHLALRDTLYRLAEAHECWLDAMAVPAEDAAAARHRLKGVMLSLGAALVLYDNYLLAISQFQGNDTLRRYLNNQDAGYGLDYGALNKVAQSFASDENRQRVRRAIVFYESEKRRLGQTLEQDSGLRYLSMLISQSPSYNTTRRYSPLDELSRMLDFYTPLTMDTMVRLTDEGVSMSSMMFGNLVGLVESRRGKLDGRLEVEQTLADSLRAGDILLEKTPFRLTDSFIPGHWGHAAIWVGTETELRALGIWEHPVVRPRQQAIQRGAGVVEALRSGVEMHSLAHFLNVDDLAVLRHIELEPQARAEVIVRTLRQVGKGYDFNFDVQTTDRIVCSELVYHAYAEMDWPTERRLGRATISPDNVAVRAIDGGPFSVVHLYRDGRSVDEDPQQGMHMLLAQQTVSK